MSPPEPTDTVTVLSSAKRLEFDSVAVTVTVVAPASSATLDGLRERSTNGVSSSSASVRFAGFTVRPADEPETEIVLSTASMPLSVGVSVNVAVPLSRPAAMAMSKSATAA